MNDTDEPKVFGIGNVAWPKGWTEEQAIEWRKANGWQKPPVIDVSTPAGAIKQAVHAELQRQSNETGGLMGQALIITKLDDAGVGSAPFLEVPYDGTIDLDALARHMIAALDAAGFVIVPKEPTTTMLAAGELSHLNATPENIYRAMITAASTPTTGEKG